MNEKRGGENPDELQIPDPVPKELEPSEEEVAIENAKERELSPEEIEKVMEKVQDINESGIAFSALGKLNSDKIKSLFKNGLLGDNWKTSDVKPPPKEEWIRNLPAGQEAAVWVKKTKKDKNTIVHFNITGRMEESAMWEKYKKDSSVRLPHKDIKSQIDLSSWVYYRRGGITILFDVSDFEEIPITGKKAGGSGTFRSDSHSKSEVPEAEYGFVLRHRVAPRYFTGICLRLNKPLPEYTDNYVKAVILGYQNAEDPKVQDEAARENVDPKKIETLRKKLFDYMPPIEDEIDPEKIKARVQELVGVMEESYQDKPAMLLPIYNRAGELLWPKQMSYEEVKKFVEERDKKTEE